MICLEFAVMDQTIQRVFGGIIVDHLSWAEIFKRGRYTILQSVGKGCHCPFKKF